MKRIFKVEVTEMLSTVLDIEIEMNGQSEEKAKTQAIAEVKRMYNEVELSLDSSGYTETILED